MDKTSSLDVRPASGFARVSVRHRRLLVWLLAVSVGSAVFFAWIAYQRTLDPRDLGWIFHEDPFQHVMGWEQFRNAPLVQYPITKNELYGLEWSSTIVFTDSIPVAALVLRLLSAVLPRPCQYLGWWVLLSLVLQAYWGARLILLRTDRLRDAAIGCVFFVTTPVLLERLGLQTGLGSHWLLLWALWRYCSADCAAAGSWAVLLLLAAGVHAYLFVMVGAIWIAHLVGCRLRGRLPAREVVRAGATVAVVVAWMHALGYFLVGGGAAGGTWRSNFDLLGFLAPCTGARFGLVPSLYGSPWDGSSYLGAGILVLLVASAAVHVARRRETAPASSPPAVSWAPLLVVVLGFAAFALTNHITVAHEIVAHVRMPRVFNPLYDTFRGAARMIWPAYYLILVATLWLALRAWPSRAVSPVIAAAAVLQLVDLEGFAAHKRAEIRGTGITRRLDDPIWPLVAQHYRRIVSVPASHRQADWPTFAWFAARNHMGSNIGYLSRSDPVARLQGLHVNLEAVATGHHDPETVYYFPGSALWSVARAMMGPQDVALVADGFRLVLPGGRAWLPDAPPAVPETPRGLLLGTWLTFSGGETAGWLVDGWAWPEAWGTWSSGKSASLVLPVPPNERVRVSFRWKSGVRGRRGHTMPVHLGDQVFQVHFPRPFIEQQNTFEVTTTGVLLDVRLELAARAVMPNVPPTGIGLIAARVERAADPADDEAPAAAWVPL